MRNLMIHAVVLFALLGASAAHGQQVPFKHIVIIIQENRTPDSLFGAAPASGTICGSEHDPFESGVDIDNGGPSNFPGTPPMGVCSTELVDGPGNNNAWNEGGGDHTHYPDWASQYDSGALDGACYQSSMPPCGSGNSPAYPPYTYMDPSLISQYFDIAENLGGFANYMFQTSEGPSFIAHQFLLGGSSAPTYPGDANGFYQYFVSENSASNTVVGCDVTPSTFPNWAYPLQPGDIPDPRVGDPNLPAPNECYPRNTLVTYQDPSGNIQSRGSNGFTWTYYTQLLGSIWDAPEADSQICYGLSSPTQSPYNCTGATCGTCGPGTQFSNVALPGKTSKYGYTYSSAPIFDDIQNCNLPSLSWVTPDEAWSDHPGNSTNPFDLGYGPYWVADIINSIGNATTCDSGAGYWSDTAVFVTWDDWGGFYDHVPPPAVYAGTGPYPDWTCPLDLMGFDFGCGYVYGFRVPLLVVSAQTPAGYVSGSIAGLNNVTYPPLPQYTHDFGSILDFVEQNFAALNQGLGPIANGIKVNGQFVTYADQNALDSCNNTCVPLSDFFQGTQSFNTISVPDGYGPSFFQTYYNNHQPMGPDEGADGDN